MNRFPDGARVCFVGDSITHNNRYIAHIAAYYRRHFPEAKVEFYNCGISGALLRCTLACFDEDIRPYNPTHVVLMMGVNDSNRTALKEKTGDEKYEAIEAAFDRYKERLNTFCGLVKDMGAQLTLCTPMPYAEYMDSDEEPLRGGYALILAYADYLRGFAKENGYPLCDYHAYATRVMQTETITRPDRVHPTERGQYHMAKRFLSFQGFDLGEEKPLPADVAKWHEVVQDVRATIAAEHFVMHDDFTSTDEQRMDAIKQWLEQEKDRPDTDYYKELYQRYLRIKKNQKENIKFVVDFMKNQ